MFYAHYQFLSPNAGKKRKKGTVVHDFKRMLAGNEIILPDSKIKFLDTQTKECLRACCLHSSGYLHKFANEPSLGFYRVREHCGNKIPRLSDKEETLKKIEKLIENKMFEVKYAMSAAKHTHKSRIPIRKIYNKLNKYLNDKPPVELKKEEFLDDEKECNVEDFDVDDDFNIQSVEKSFKKEEEIIRARVKKYDESINNKLKKLLEDKPSDDIAIEYKIPKKKKKRKE